MCSVSGRPCRCDNSRGCKANRRSVDNLPTELIQRIKTLLLHVQVCQDDCDFAADYDDLVRIYPQPELRDVRRRLVETERVLKEILK